MTRPGSRAARPPTIAEDFNDLSVDPASTSYFEKRVNNGNSALVEVVADDPDAGVTVPAADAQDVAERCPRWMTAPRYTDDFL